MVAAIIGEEGEVLIMASRFLRANPRLSGEYGDAPVIGLPGHLAFAFIVLIAIIRHLFEGMTGNADSGLRSLQATLGQNISSSKGREDYVRVAVRDGIATPLFGKSGLLNTLVKSTGIVRIPAESEGLETGTLVEVILW